MNKSTIRIYQTHTWRTYSRWYKPNHVSEFTEIFLNTFEKCFIYK